jgi:hypothetical protein
LWQWRLAQKRRVFIAFAVFGPKNSVVEKLFERSKTAQWRSSVRGASKRPLDTCGNFVALE